jgi:hypothetical protein
MQFAGKEDVALKVVDISLDPAAVLVLLIHKTDLSELLVAEIASGFSPNQPCPIAFIKVVDVYLNRSTRWNAERIGKRSHYWAY